MTHKGIKGLIRLDFKLLASVFSALLRPNSKPLVTSNKNKKQNPVCWRIIYYIFFKCTRPLWQAVCKSKSLRNHQSIGIWWRGEHNSIALRSLAHNCQDWVRQVRTFLGSSFVRDGNSWRVAHATTLWAGAAAYSKPPTFPWSQRCLKESQASTHTQTPRLHRSRGPEVR